MYPSPPDNVLDSKPKTSRMAEPASPPKSILESMELVRLPSPPHILSKLLDVCHDPGSSTSDLADIISFDAALTSKLTMAVNKAAFAIDLPITSLEKAVTLIGHGKVKSMVITSSIQQLFAGLINSQKVFLYNTWLDSVYCAVFARYIAIAIEYEHPQDAYLAGLLHDVGKIVLDARDHDQYVKIANADTEAETITQEISKYGASHAELGAAILKQWPSLSPSIADATRYHHETEELLQGGDILCRIVAEASDLARYWSRTGNSDPKWQSKLLSKSELDKVYLQVQHNLAQTATWLGITSPEGRSLTRDDLIEEIEKETIRLARKIRDASLVTVISPEELQIEELDSPQNLLLKVAQEMQLFFSVSNVSLLFHDLKSPDFLTLYEVGLALPVSRFSLEGNNSQAIKSFTGKCKLWIEPENTSKRQSPISDRQITRRLQHDIALSLPMMYEDEIIGTIVIGAHKTQQNNLEKLSDIIAGYLENIAGMWLRRNSGFSGRDFKGEAGNKKAQKDIDMLIHEISNPLSVIGNYIDIVQHKSDTDDAESSREIAILKDELQRVRNIVLNFKEDKDIETGPIFLNTELEACIPLYVKSQDSDNGAQVMWCLDRTDAKIDIPRDVLRQIILNLVKNAVEAQTDAAIVMVSSYHFVNIDGRAFAQFSISDRGKGVDGKTRGLLFSPLSSKKKGGGRGLGLSVVAEALKRYDGQIRYMQNEAMGALFEVSIPLSTER